MLRIGEYEYHFNNKIETKYYILYFSEESTPASASAGASSMIQKKKKRLRKADTNVVSVKFDRLLQPGN